MPGTEVKSLWDLDKEYRSEHYRGMRATPETEEELYEEARTRARLKRYWTNRKTKRYDFVFMRVFAFLAKYEGEEFYLFLKGGSVYVVPKRDINKGKAEIAFDKETMVFVEQNYIKYNATNLFHEWFKDSMQSLSCIGEAEMYYTANEKAKDEEIPQRKLPTSGVGEQHVYVLTTRAEEFGGDYSFHRYMIATKGKFFKFLEDMAGNPLELNEDIPFEKLVSDEKRYIEFMDFEEVAASTRCIEQIYDGMIKGDVAGIEYVFTQR